MIKSIHDAYHKWIFKEIIKDKIHDVYNYTSLIRILDSITFVPYDPMDKNRITDAVELRYRFARTKDIPDEKIKSTIDEDDPSVFEVMVALALRMYESTTGGFPYPIKSNEIFWMMVENMRLENQTNDECDEQKIRAAVNRMMSHDIQANGNGGMFRISDESRNMRDAELWYQAQWWAIEVWNKMTKLMKTIK